VPSLSLLLVSGHVFQDVCRINTRGAVANSTRAPKRGGGCRGGNEIKGSRADAARERLGGMQTEVRKFLLSGEGNYSQTKKRRDRVCIPR
jgi:hypothetical protein